MNGNIEAENIYKLAFSSLWNARAEALASVDGSSVEHSPDFDENIAAIFAKRTPKRKKTAKFYFRRALIVLLSVFALTLTACAAIPPLRENVLEPIVETVSHALTTLNVSASIEYEDGEIVFSYRRPRSGKVGETKVLQYVPANHIWRPVIAQKGQSGSAYIVYCADNGDMVSYKQSPLGTNVTRLDRSTTELSLIRVSGYPAYLVTTTVDGSVTYSVYFSDGVSEFFIDTNYDDLAVVMKIAENIY